MTKAGYKSYQMNLDGNLTPIPTEQLFEYTTNEFGDNYVFKK